MSHTPGPWEVREGGSEVFGSAIYAPGAHDLDPLAAVDHLDPNEEADACLIASAPELLEALEEIARINAVRDNWLWATPVGEIAQVAIAKARGSLTRE